MTVANFQIFPNYTMDGRFKKTFGIFGMLTPPPPPTQDAIIRREGLGWDP